ncbi:hypothetical protein [Bdellovibrio bacteriovorus]|uniref:hypothetical protein n=1 Tax=Bdellovibrio bacteriovorus TaxID=959 RepID=UPI000ADA6314|nr:hypothetical protein [Bdellovibrio bacteriovorus]
MVAISFSQAQAADPFLGCADYCAMRFTAGSKAWDNCIVQTQNEGYCGRPPSSSTPTSSQTRQENPNQNNGNNQNRNQNQNQNQQGQCYAQYESLLQQCNTQIDDTSYTCDEKNDSGMNNVASTASQLALLMGQQTSASVQAACSRMGDLSQAASGALAAYRLTCSESMKTCRSTCDSAVDYVKANPNCFPTNSATQLSAVNALSQAQSRRDKCDNFESKMNEAQQAIQNYGATSANATQCGEQNKGETSTTPDFCKSTPNYPGCNPSAPVDCTKPELASSNKVCICTKNPLDPACFSQQKTADNSQVGNLIDSSSRLAANKGDDLGGDLPGLPGIEHGQLPSGGYGDAVDGAQGGGGTSLGGGSSGSGGGYAAGLEGEGNAARDENSANVNGGYYGGGGGGSGLGGGSGGDGQPGVRQPTAAGAGGAAGKNGPDLRQFLPGGKFDPRMRGIAGASGPDGITGPHSNIWHKIQNRYKVVSPSLLPY